jgi:hypothetical protein
MILKYKFASSNIYKYYCSSGQFRPRATPSAGMIPYIQSFVCNVKNSCYIKDDYEDIPIYNGSL